MLLTLLFDFKIGSGIDILISISEERVFLKDLMSRDQGLKKGSGESFPTIRRNKRQNLFLKSSFYTSKTDNL